MRLKVEVKFEPRDLWLGVYFDSAQDKLYVCVVPCVPVAIQSDNERPQSEGAIQ